MKKTVLAVITVMLVLSMGSLFAQVNFGLNKIGGTAGFIFPEDPIESTLGVGARANVGSFGDKIDLIGEIFFWSKKYDLGLFNTEWTWTQIYFNALAKYAFTAKGSLTPYAIGGLGLIHATSKWTAAGKSQSDSDLGLGICIGGGVDYKLSPTATGFAELRYNTGKADMFGILAGVMFDLNK